MASVVGGNGFRRLLAERTRALLESDAVFEQNGIDAWMTRKDAHQFLSAIAAKTENTNTPF